MNPEIFISEDDIATRIAVLGEMVSKDFKGEELIVICVLNGAFIFCTDLIRQIELPIKLDFVSLSSYGDSKNSSGEVIVNMDCALDLRDRNVLVVEDIIDTGLTMTHYLEMLKGRGPKTIKVASLLYKPSRNIYPVPIDYLGFEIEDRFVIGFGLDYAGRYRELPYVGVLNADN